MKALVFLSMALCACIVLGAPRQRAKPTGEEGIIIALESAWDQAEKTKDANALANLLADNLVYVDYDGSISTKREFLASIRSADVAEEQINNEGVTVHLYNNVAVSTGIYRDKGMEKGKPFQRRGRFTNVWLNQNGKWQCIASQSTLIAR